MRLSLSRSGDTFGEQVRIKLGQDRIRSACRSTAASASKQELVLVCSTVSIYEINSGDRQRLWQASRRKASCLIWRRQEHMEHQRHMHDRHMQSGGGGEGVRSM